MAAGLAVGDLGRLVTIAVSPRERHYSIIPSLISLFATVPRDVRVIVAQGDLPDDLRQHLNELRKIRPFDLIEPPFPLYPQEARNLCMEASETEFVVIADNDIEYEEGWLEAIVGNAIANDADVVAPLIFIGPPRATEIHHAGGRIQITRGPNDRLEARELHQLAKTRFSEAGVSTLGSANHTVEFHCFLVRASYSAKAGHFDERLTTQEQIHYGLLARHLGAKVTFEGGARVTYVAKNLFHPDDLRYLSFRWNDQQALESVRAIESMWGIFLEEERLLNGWVRRHRLQAYSTLYKKQRESMSLVDFYLNIICPIELPAQERAMQLRAGKMLHFTNPIDVNTRAATVESFLINPVPNTKAAEPAV